MKVGKFWSSLVETQQGYRSYKQKGFGYSKPSMGQ